MKVTGIIGGIGSEATVDYYRSIIARYRAQRPEGGYPQIIINSIDQSQMGRIVGRHRDKVTACLVPEIQRLAKAGADFGIIAASTPHIAFNDLQRESPIPLLSIVEATCKEARARGLLRMALLGTRFTMQASFYSSVFREAGMQLALPNNEEQLLVHKLYLTELLRGRFLPATRGAFLEIASTLQARERPQAIILAGAELCLLLRGCNAAGIAFLDTTEIHVNAAVAWILDGAP